MSQVKDLLETVTTDVVLPILKELDHEVGQPIAVEILVAHSGEVLTREARTRSPVTANEAKGKVKIVLKASGEQDCFNFSGEAILQGLSPGTGFSGFSIRGRVTSVGARSSAKLLARTNRYNVWNWGRDFNF